MVVSQKQNIKEFLAKTLDLDLFIEAKNKRKSKFLPTMIRNQMAMAKVFHALNMSQTPNAPSNMNQEFSFDTINNITSMMYQICTGILEYLDINYFEMCE
jgi:hypothetical protein